MRNGDMIKMPFLNSTSTALLPFTESISLLMTAVNLHVSKPDADSVKHSSQTCNHITRHTRASQKHTRNKNSISHSQETPVHYAKEIPSSNPPSFILSSSRKQVFYFFPIFFFNLFSARTSFFNLASTILYLPLTPPGLP